MWSPVANPDRLSKSILTFSEDVFREVGSGPTSLAHANSRRGLQFSSEEVEAELAKIESMIDVLKSQIQRSGSESPLESVCLWETENAIQATEAIRVTSPFCLERECGLGRRGDPILAASASPLLMVGNC